MRFLFLDKFSDFRWKLQIIIALLHLSVTCTLLQNKEFIRIVFKECVSRSVSDGGHYSHTNESNTAAAKKGVKNAFFGICNVI